MTIDLGTAPDWLAASAAALALVFANQAVRLNRKTSAQQDLQIRALQDERVRRQATKIAVWPTVTNDGRFAYCVSNQSDLPIYRVVLKAERSYRTTKRNTHRIVLSPPGTEVVRPDELDWPHTPNDVRIVRTQIEFLDTAGHSWIRAFDGSLVDGGRIPGEVESAGSQAGPH